MNFKNYYLYFLFFYNILNAQNGFQLVGNTSKVSIPFDLVNNLIIIPINVNGVKLNFLLDTGVSETIIFSLDDAGEVIFNQSQTIKMKGFGKKEDFDAYRCRNNKLAIKDYVDVNHTIYLVLYQEINISSQVGIPVNGIIGYHFFKNNPIKIDYISKRLTILQGTKRQIDKIDKKYSKVRLSFNDNKPYLQSTTTFEPNNESVNSKLLIDTGNSDALWLFKERDNRIKIPNKNIDDFLGRGLNGDVFGKRGRIKSFDIDKYNVENPITSFPDSVVTSSIDLAENRVGSVGNEIMKRFDVVFDYNSNLLYLKKNSNFSEPFLFNMSGIEVQHQGLQWIKDSYEVNPAINNNVFDANGEKVKNNLQFKFELKPIFIISNIRRNSPAEACGLLRNDILVKINGDEATNLKLQEINNLLKSEDDRNIKIEVDRKGQILKFKFQLKSIL